MLDLNSMRIIAGEFRGRHLIAPEGEVTRPITDRVKQSLFDILAPLIPNSHVYDLFAGTGSMGLECLSRGATHVLFFEEDWSARDRLRQNIKALGVGERSKIIPGDLFDWFMLNPIALGPRVNLIFFDPPYKFTVEKPVELANTVESIAGGHITEDATLIFRRDATHALEINSLKKYDVRTYGGMTLEFYHPTTYVRPESNIITEPENPAP